MAKPFDGQYYEVVGERSFSERLLVKAREAMYRDFIDRVQPTESTSIVDIGVSDVQTNGANWLETVYPYPERLHACGLGVGDDFRKTYPQTPYTRIAPEKPLPFDDGTFDVATSNAVLEHVGSRENQRRFISELCRVAHTVFLTVPHRYFPVEHHTALPILHYSDTSFAVACRLIGKTYWLDETNLILMSKQHLTSLAPVNSKIGYTGLRIGPFSSNLYLFLDARRKASS